MEGERTTSDESREIAFVTFDLDDTLLQYERSPGAVLRSAFAALGTDPLFPVEAYYARYDEFAAQSDSMDELRSDCFAALAAENGYEQQLGREVAAAFSEQRDQSNVELLPGAARVLEQVSQQYRVAIITNGAPDAQQQKIDAVGIEQWVETTIVAGSDTPPKPDPEPFERAMHSLGCAPASTIHVGDSLETDIAGATAAGIDSVWLSPESAPPEFDPTYRVDSLADMLDLPWLDDPATETR